MQTADFDFTLPDRLIADRPAQPRDAARLLLVGAALQDRIIRDLPAILREGDLMVFNDTRVIPARIEGERPARLPGGAPARIEATLLKAEVANDRNWQALARPMKRLREGDRLIFAGGVEAKLATIGLEGEIGLRFDRPAQELMAKLHEIGAMPLPPYIRKQRADRPEDAGDYQTVFAARDGAVAAPTAGLHFTPELLKRLDAAGVGRAGLTLHVGAGTFLPVKAERLEDHRMHSEWGEISAATARAIASTREAGGRVIAIGTTSLRLMESALDTEGRVQPFSGETAIFIKPGTRVRSADLLLTNFHLPRSTLFMLVAAFAGLERMKSAYAHAIESGYRFYSFGDGSLLERAS